MSDILILASIVMLALLFLKVPVYIAVLGGSMVYFLLNPDINSIVFAQQAIVGTEKISLLAIPFFVCAGIFMNYTGVTKRIMNFCEVVTGRLPGGLAQVNVLLSTVMGGLSGSNIADAAMESKMLVPEMTKKGFSLEFSSVVTAASSMITPLIPPGIAMILYGCIANVSIGKLFISGIGVGGLLCVTMMILVGIISKKRGYGNLSTEKMSWPRFWKVFRPAVAAPRHHHRGNPDWRVYRYGGRSCCHHLCRNPGYYIQGNEADGFVPRTEGNRMHHGFHHVDCIRCLRILLDPDQGTDSSDANRVDAGHHPQQNRVPHSG